MKYKLGDEFLSLVKNERAGIDIGDLLIIVEAEDKPHPAFDYLIALKETTFMTKNGMYEYVWDKAWWYNVNTMDQFVIPVHKVTEKDLFTVRMTGKLPGFTPLIFTRDIDEILQVYDDSKDVIDAGVKAKKWELEYFYGVEIEL